MTSDYTRHSILMLFPPRHNRHDPGLREPLPVARRDVLAPHAPAYHTIRTNAPRPMTNDYTKHDTLMLFTSAQARSWYQ
jgi:hypothetical protein